MHIRDTYQEVPLVDPWIPPGPLLVSSPKRLQLQEQGISAAFFERMICWQNAGEGILP